MAVNYHQRYPKNSCSQPTAITGGRFKNLPACRQELAPESGHHIIFYCVLTIPTGREGEGPVAAVRSQGRYPPGSDVSCDRLMSRSRTLDPWNNGTLDDQSSS